MATSAKERELPAQSDAPAGEPSPQTGMEGAGATSAGPDDAASAAAAGTGPAQVRVRQADLALGQIVSVLMRSPQHKHHSLADLEWLVLPAVLSGQFRIAHAQQSGAPTPVGVALWASVSAEVDKRLSDLSAPARLRPNEWRSGDILWLMELVCDAAVQQALLKDVGQTVFQGRPIKMRVRGPDGKPQIGTLRAGGEEPKPA